MPASALLAAMRAARENWVECGDGKAVCLLRPRFEDLRLFRGTSRSELVGLFAVRWRGITEADLLPSGGSDQVEYDRDVLLEWLADKPGIADTLSTWLVKAASERARAEAGASSGN